MINKEVAAIDTVNQEIGATEASNHANIQIGNDDQGGCRSQTFGWVSQKKKENAKAVKKKVAIEKKARKQVAEMAMIPAAEKVLVSIAKPAEVIT